MKRLTLLFLAFVVIYSAMGQLRPHSTKMLKDYKVLATEPSNGDEPIGTTPPGTNAFSMSALDDPSTMVSRYDCQTNHSCQNRMHYYPDGTIGVTMTMAHNDNFADRGTGYNYFDGTEWGAAPEARIETVKTGWPSYAPWGSGEIVVTHSSSNSGLIISRRASKGNGPWTQTVLAGPEGAVGLAWPRAVTSGPDHNDIHIICVSGGTYQGLTNALLYYRSLDGGETWETQARVIEGITSDDYLGIWSDSYSWAEPRGDTLCFMAGFSWNDLFILKSFDNGTTWTKTLIWPCPYNKWAGEDSTGTFWSPDGGSSIALDKYGKAHMTFGLTRGSGDENGNRYWFPFTDGLVYWNEDMPQLPFDINPDTLFAHHNYIGWTQDTTVFDSDPSELAQYHNWTSMTSFSTLVVDDQDRIFVMWSGVTNHRDPNNFMLRHIFTRVSTDLGNNWSDTITDLTGSPEYDFTECVYPTASPTSSTDNIFLIFQADAEAGAYLWGIQGYQGQQGIDDNQLIFLSPLKNDVIYVGTEENKSQPDFIVSQNAPNPAQGITSVQVKLEHPAFLSLEIYSTIGEKVLELHKGQVSAGSWQFLIDASGLKPGIYFYSVKAGKQQITKKMIVG